MIFGTFGSSRATMDHQGMDGNDVIHQPLPHHTDSMNTHKGQNQPQFLKVADTDDCLSPSPLQPEGSRHNPIRVTPSISAGNRVADADVSIDVPVEVIDDISGITVEEDSDQESDDPEMTTEEIANMYQAARDGDVDLLDDLLDLPGADINVTWFSENLLMSAIRAGKEEMAVFLIDNDINFNYETTKIDIATTNNPFTRHVDLYSINCRQMAYDYKLFSIVELIDQKNKQSWPNVKQSVRNVRLKRPLSEKLRERAQICGEDGELLEENMSEKDIDDDDANCVTSVKSTEVDDISSGYSTLSSSGSQEFKLLRRRTPVQKVHKHNMTKTTLSRLQSTKEKIAENAEKQRMYGTPSTTHGGYFSDSNAWATKTQKNVYFRSGSTRSLTRTLSPWRDDPQTNRSKSAPCLNKTPGKAYIGDNFNMGNFANMHKGAAHARQMTPSLHSNITSANLNVGQKGQQSLFRPSSKEGASTPRKDKDANISTASVLQIMNKSVKDINNPPRTVHLGSVVRHRGQDHKQQNEVCSGGLRKKYSPAGHIKTVSARRPDIR